MPIQDESRTLTSPHDKRSYPPLQSTLCVAHDALSDTPYADHSQPCCLCDVVVGARHNKGTQSEKPTSCKEVSSSCKIGWLRGLIATIGTILSSNPSTDAPTKPFAWPSVQDRSHCGCTRLRDPKLVPWEAKLHQRETGETFTSRGLLLKFGPQMSSTDTTF